MKLLFIKFLLIMSSFLITIIFLEKLMEPQETRAITETNDEHHYPRPYVMAAGKPFTEFGGKKHNVLGYKDFPSINKKNEVKIIHTDLKQFLIETKNHVIALDMHGSFTTKDGCLTRLK